MSGAGPPTTVRWSWLKAPREPGIYCVMNTFFVEVSEQDVERSALAGGDPCFEAALVGEHEGRNLYALREIVPEPELRRETWDSVASVTALIAAAIVFVGAFWGYLVLLTRAWPSGDPRFGEKPSVVAGFVGLPLAYVLAVFSRLLVFTALDAAGGCAGRVRRKGR